MIGRLIRTVSRLLSPLDPPQSQLVVDADQALRATADDFEAKRAERGEDLTHVEQLLLSVIRDGFGDRR